jgi:hypothetical protein
LGIWDVESGEKRGEWDVDAESDDAAPGIVSLLLECIWAELTGSARTGLAERWETARARPAEQAGSDDRD